MRAAVSHPGLVLDSWLEGNRLVWEPALPEEREPHYSGRVLVPRLRWLTSMEKDFSSVVKGDGPGQQSCDPVYLGGKRFIPDISMIENSSNRIALEVKFFDGRASKLKEALGQSLIYLSGSYDLVRVLLVSLSGKPSLRASDLSTLNDAAPGAQFRIYELFDRNHGE